MTYVIAEPCIGTKDRSCVDVCPVDCIHDDGDADRILYINPEECIDCGACEPACPVTAIFVDYDVPEQSVRAVRAGPPQAVARSMVPTAVGDRGKPV